MSSDTPETERKLSNDHSTFLHTETIRRKTLNFNNNFKVI